jgi:hypothetical protein
VVSDTAVGYKLHEQEEQAALQTLGLKSAKRRKKKKEKKAPHLLSANSVYGTIGPCFSPSQATGIGVESMYNMR